MPSFRRGDLVLYASNFSGPRPTIGSNITNGDGSGFSIYYSPPQAQILYNEDNLDVYVSDGVSYNPAQSTYPIGGTYQVVGFMSGRVGSQDTGQIKDGDGAGAWYNENGTQADVFVLLLVRVS